MYDVVELWDISEYNAEINIVIIVVTVIVLNCKCLFNFWFSFLNIESFGEYNIN